MQRVNVGGHTATVIQHRHRAVFVQGDIDACGMAAKASSTELSITSCARWLGRVVSCTCLGVCAQGLGHQNFDRGGGVFFASCFKSLVVA